MTDQANQYAQPATMLAALDGVYENANQLIGGLNAEQWTAQTPCTEWNVRDLVNHMAGTTNFLRCAATRSAPAGAPDADHLGDNPAAAFAAAAEETMAAWRADGALDGMVTVPVEMPAIAALGVNIIDIGTHCWDLAEAVGAEHGLSENLVNLIDYWNRQVVTDQVRSGGGFGQALDPATSEDLPTMLAFVGRES